MPELKKKVDPALAVIRIVWVSPREHKLTLNDGRVLTLDHLTFLGDAVFLLNLGGPCEAQVPNLIPKKLWQQWEKLNREHHDALETLRAPMPVVEPHKPTLKALVKKSVAILDSFLAPEPTPTAKEEPVAPRKSLRKPVVTKKKGAK